MGRIKRQGNDGKVMRNRNYKCEKHKRSYTWLSKYAHARHMKIYHNVVISE